MSGAHVLPVFLTVDTELWPAQAGWPRRPLPASKHDFSEELAVDIHGQTSAGCYGLPYQIGCFNRHGLRATYFVEALFSQREGGAAALAHICGLIQRGGHEVQLHLHGEWLAELDHPVQPRRHCQYLSQLPLAAQSELIKTGIAALAQAGVPGVQAFRAGSYGANLDTLRALAQNGMHVDSSYNPSYLNGQWGSRRIDQPCRIDGVWEFPIASFHDFARHSRHAQLSACSSAELRHALLSAWRARWPAFVIVLHSFELIRKNGPGKLPSPHSRNIARLERLCSFLASERERLPTAVFSELALQQWQEGGALPPLHSRLSDSLWRVAEQGWSRFR
ncbi:hypothetical protein HSX11_10225 [Oxalobacteraceae bacterium]|nr:hypothetical protein [Oxalobacteraceae bacterium]